MAKGSKDVRPMREEDHPGDHHPPDDGKETMVPSASGTKQKVPMAELATLKGFARHMLGFTPEGKGEPYGWQDRAFESIEPRGSNTVMLCNNESGKTRVVAASAVLWHMTRFKRSVTLCTAGVYRQVAEQLWPELYENIDDYLHGESQWKKTEGEIVFKPHNSICYGFSTDQGNKFEGYHRRGGTKGGGNLMIVVDEAKSVPETIFQAVDRCRPTRLLIMSSAGDKKGMFYQLATDPPPGYTVIKVTAFDCPHIEPEWIDRMIAKWGKDHPLVRSMIFSEFMEGAGERTVLTLDQVQACVARMAPVVGKEHKVAFCDFAAEGDSNCFAVMIGTEVMPLMRWKGTDTMHNLARFIMEFKKWNLAGDEIYVDIGGMGLPMRDRMHEMGWKVHGVQNGESAQDKMCFANRGTEIWVEAARQIELGKVRLPAEDSELAEQLISRRLLTDSKGRLIVESKKDMRARGLPSPDAADAVLGAIAHNPALHATYRPKSAMLQFWEHEEQREMDNNSGALVGANPGW